MLNADTENCGVVGGARLEVGRKMNLSVSKKSLAALNYNYGEPHRIELE